MGEHRPAICINIMIKVEVGFNEEEAEAMAYIADQRTKGKLYGLISGVFGAYSLGRLYPNRTYYPNVPLRLAQLAFIIVFFD